jgi:hypothetical protein
MISHRPSSLPCLRCALRSSQLVGQRNTRNVVVKPSLLAHQTSSPLVHRSLPVTSPATCFCDRIIWVARQSVSSLPRSASPVAGARSLFQNLHALSNCHAICASRFLLSWPRRPFTCRSDDYYLSKNDFWSFAGGPSQSNSPG